MGLRGYYFNTKGRYMTYKFPHCYVGVKGLKEGAHWGPLNNKGRRSNWGRMNSKGIAYTWGNYNGGSDMQVQHTLKMDQTDFNYDHTPGFAMAVEKTWHSARPVSLNKDIVLYDIEGNELEPNNYGIVIWYKIVVPLALFSASGEVANDLLALNRVYGNQYSACLDNANRIGQPVLEAGGNGNFRGVIVSGDHSYSANKNDAYMLPSLMNKSGIAQSDFATGADLSSAFGVQLDNIGNSSVTQTAAGSGGFASNSSDSHFLFMNIGGRGTTGATVGIIIDPIASQINYTLDISTTLMNIPTEDSRSWKHLLPLLFKPFGMMPYQRGSSAPMNNAEMQNITKYECAWFYYVLGVDKFD